MIISAAGVHEKEVRSPGGVWPDELQIPHVAWSKQEDT